MAVAGALPVLAYLVIPAVHQVEDLVVEEAAEREVELCLTDNENGVLAADEESAFGASQVAALSLFLLWKLMMGVAITTYWTLGVAYMVDAISPLVVPAALGKLSTLWQNSNTKPALLHIKLFKEFKTLRRVLRGRLLRRLPRQPARLCLSWHRCLVARISHPFSLPCRANSHAHEVKRIRYL